MRSRLSSLLLLLILASLLLVQLGEPAAAGSAPRCSICNEEVRGTYWRADNKVYCQRCYTTLPRCGACGSPMRSFTAVEGKNLCGSCLATMPRCCVCSRPMVQYWEIEGKKYCGDCGKSVVGNCALCGALLKGESWIVRNTLDGDSLSYCAFCFRNARKCDLCSWRVPSSMRPCADGRYFCQRCASFLVADPEQLGAIYSEVLEVLSTVFGMSLKQRPVFHPVGQDDFLAQVGHRHGYEKGESLGLFSCSKGKRGHGKTEEVIIENPAIYILHPLPRDAAYWAVAHETGHAWYEENTRDVRRDKMLVEGFAEWIAYKVLTLKGFRKEPAFMAARKDLYGDGLRVFLERERTGGWGKVLEWVRSL